VFASKVGTPLDPSHVRRDFRGAIGGAEGIEPAAWTPRELRHSFVSLLSDRGVPLEEISRLVGHSSTSVTEDVYRLQIRSVVQTGAVAMDGIFGAGPKDPEGRPAAPARLHSHALGHPGTGCPVSDTSPWVEEFCTTASRPTARLGGSTRVKQYAYYNMSRSYVLGSDRSKATCVLFLGGLSLDTREATLSAFALSSIVLGVLRNEEDTD
jgi:hypothetical protein